MYIITSLIANNTRIPVILSQNKTPYLLPLLFTITNLKEKSYSTKYNYIRIIYKFYRYFEEKGIKVEENIISSDFTQIILNLENFLFYTIDSKSRKNKDILSNFIMWSSNRYSNNPNIGNRIKSIFTFNAVKISNKIRNQYRSLELKDLETVRNIIDLKSEYNPFKEAYKLRNWVIVEILIQTGLRLGELLKLKVNDFIRIEDRFYIKITDHKNDSEDLRIIKPSNKNIYSFRTIAITPNLYDIIQIFIKKYRKLSKKINHSYLLISDLGYPLSIRATQNIFLIINKCIKEKYIIENFDFSAHVLRHTFADNFLKFLIEEKKYDMERAKDELRMICGWNISSDMPTRYASRYISLKASDHNVERLKHLYK